MTATSLFPFRDAAASIEDLRARITGEVILPGDTEYENVRLKAAATHQRFPSMVVRVASAEDVAETVRFARRQGILFSVLGGGHSLGGHSTMGGIVIDLSAMNGVAIDPERRMAQVQGGARSRDLAIPAHEHGLAMSTGDTGSVGLGGLVTGGGIGWFVRQYGLAADRLRSARIVLADGQLVTASPTQNSDLFWAIRGGGGNFGIVVEFEFELVPVRHVTGGAIVLPATREVVRGYLEYTTSMAPDELSTTATITHAPPAPFIPEDRVGEVVLLILAAWCGDEDAGERALAPLRELAEPVADTTARIPYPGMFQYMEWAEAAHRVVPRMMFTDEFPDQAIDDSIAAIENATSPVSAVHLRGLGGELARIDEGSTAFIHRQRRYFVSILSLWFELEDDGAAHRAWAEDLWAKIAYLREGSYVNFLGDEGDARIRDAYPTEVYERLAAVKAKYDPENVFRFNQNVRPAAHALKAA